MLNTPAKTNSPVVIQTPAGPRRIPHNTPNQTPDRHTVSNQPNLSPAQLASRKLESGYNPETPSNFPHHSSVMLIE